MIDKGLVQTFIWLQFCKLTILKSGQLFCLTQIQGSKVETYLPSLPLLLLPPLPAPGTSIAPRLAGRCNPIALVLPCSAPAATCRTFYLDLSSNLPGSGLAENKT